MVKNGNDNFPEIISKMCHEHDKQMIPIIYLETNVHNFLKHLHPKQNYEMGLSY